MYPEYFIQSFSPVSPVVCGSFLNFSLVPSAFALCLWACHMCACGVPSHNTQTQGSFSLGMHAPGFPRRVSLGPPAKTEASRLHGFNFPAASRLLTSCENLFLKRPRKQTGNYWSKFWLAWTICLFMLTLQNSQAVTFYKK